MHIAWRLTARAAGTGDGVLGGGLVAGAVEGALFAAGAFGLGGADATSALVGLAAGGSGVDHCGGGVDLAVVVVRISWQLNGICRLYGFETRKSQEMIECKDGMGKEYLR